MSDPNASASHNPRRVLGLTLGALGVVFGDIGTSPLYAFQECVHGEHGVSPENPENVLGVLSLIFWSIMLVVTLKYLTFLMRADNRGEGGIMALLALVPSQLRNLGPGRIGTLGMLVIIGAALLYGDGLITPAISVLSAVEGVTAVQSSLTDYVVPITCLILFGLFAIQSHGTNRIGSLFGPVMLVWFLVIGSLGVWHLVGNPRVLEALLPHHAVKLFIDHGFHGFRLLGSVVLTVTGGEALYADMGHFGRRPIRFAWLSVACPALLLCYFGQGAMVLEDPSTSSRVFYSMVPAGPATYALVVIATLATIVASQALISGIFSLTREAIQLGYFPRLSIKHTSGEHQGQIYLPLVNWGLGVGCIALVLWAQQSTRLAAAYGLAVSGTMAITSVVFYVVTRHTWNWSRWKAVPLLVLFLIFDLAFLGANCLKFLDGGYVPFSIGALFVVVMVIWRMGRSLLTEVMTRGTPTTEQFLESHRRDLHRIPGTAVCMASSIQHVPVVLARLARRLRVAHERFILLTVETASTPYVPVSERAELEELSDGFYRVRLHYGFMQTPHVPSGLQLASDQSGLSLDLKEVLYLIGHETFEAGRGGKMGRVTEQIFALLSRNSRTATDYFGLPPEQVLEVGERIDL